MFKGQPKGLYALALANTGERFGYYTMLAVFALFLRANFGLEAGVAGAIYSTFLGLVYFMPLVGGVLADKFGYGKMVTIGITVMFAGYLLLSKRDEAFSIFYMAINVGALFAPTAAVEIKEWAETSLGFSSNDAYHFSFAVACVALIISMGIYYTFRSSFRHIEGGKSKSGEKAVAEKKLSAGEMRQRIIALCLVFAVVIFFWMAFHQNGLTLTYFANEFNEKSSEGFQSMFFSVWNLVLIIIGVYALFSLFQSETTRGRVVAGSIVAGVVAVLYYKYLNLNGPVAVSAPIFQQFNPFYVVALTPVSIAIFSALARRGKEPSAPRKIAYGMLVASAGFAIMAVGSLGLLTPDTQEAAVEAGEQVPLVSSNWLISTYLVLTFAELLLSPMGISFVSKVAPPQYKGMMMGGWFGATAIGNLLVAVGGFLWGGIPLWAVWTVFIVLCLLSAVFMFSMMKKLESVTTDA